MRAGCDSVRNGACIAARALDAGETITISAVAEREALRLRKSGKITGDEFPRVRAYFANQISGAVSAAKEKATGLRLYLALGKGQFVHRSGAPEEVWTDHLLGLMAESRTTTETVKAWMDEQRKTFGRLPREVETALREALAA